MIQELYEKLEAGDLETTNLITASTDRLSDLLNSIGSRDLEYISTTLSDSQLEIEQICGARNLGKCILPLSCFSYLFSHYRNNENLRELASKLEASFSRSSCSNEVKVYAREAAQLYSI